MPWSKILETEFNKPYFQALSKKLAEENKQYTIYPPKDEIFTAFKLCEFEQVKICVIGQDVYHQPGQAHGLAFSVKKGITIPPSLKNIYKELQADLNLMPPKHGNLENWAKEGVLLLNSMLTVRANSPSSHKDLGWQVFTDNIISTLNKLDKPLVYLLWGKFAQSKASLITNPKHHQIHGSHPSPYSCQGFFGGRYFSKANQYLQQHGITPINWHIDD